MNTIQNTSNNVENNSNNIKNPYAINFKVAKWGILILSSFLIMGDFYAYDVPYAIKEQLRLKFSSSLSNNFDYYFNFLYSVYTFPNIFMPFLNGYITDKLGDRRMLTILGIVVFLGAVIMYLGSSYNLFWLLVFGRFIYGLGGDSITSTQWVLIMEYFHSEKEVGVALMMVYIFTTFGSSMNLYFSPIIAKHVNCDAVFMVTTIICFSAMFFRYFIYQIDKNAQKLLPEHGEITKSTNATNASSEQKESRIQKIVKCLRLGKRYWYNTIYSLFMVVSLNGLFYISSNFFMQKWYSKLSKIDADRESTTYNFLSSTLSLIFVPVAGFLSDKFCLHSNFGVLAPLITQISFFLYMTLHPLIPTIIYSLGYSLNYTAVWSNISLCVDNHHMGIAMGLIYSLQNVALLITPNLTLFIQKESNSYEDTIVFLMFMNILAFIYSLLYHYEQKKVASKYNQFVEDNSEKLKPVGGQLPIADQIDVIP